MVKKYLEALYEELNTTREIPLWEFLALTEGLFLWGLILGLWAK